MYPDQALPDVGTPSVPDAILLARAYLSRVAEPASLVLWDWVRRHGVVDAAQAIQTGDVPPNVAALTAARRHTADPHADMDAAQRLGIRLVVPESADWPHLAVGALERAALARLASGRPATAVERE